MAEEQKDKWLGYLALATVLLALGATLSTLKSAGFTNKGILYQTQAANKWSHYQAKSIKGYLYELQQEKLEMDLKSMSPTNQQELMETYQTRIEEYKKELKRYDQEKKEISAEARGFENQRDEALRHSKVFGTAVILLQLAVLLNSLAGLMKNKNVWVLGLVLGGVGFLYFINGFVLFLPEQLMF